MSLSNVMRAGKGADFFRLMSSLRGAVLVTIIFAISFLLPLGAWYLIQKNISSSGDTVSDVQEISTPLAISKDRAIVRIAHQEGLNPEEGRDYLITAWFNLRSLPTGKDKIPLIAKQTADSRNKEGFVVSLGVEQGGYRISVSWKESSGKGRIFHFSDISLLPQTWFMVAVSLHDGRYLGLHTVTLIPGRKPQVKLIGGYDMTVEVRPDSKSDITLGSARAGQFRGLLGPVGIFQGKSVGEELPKALKKMGAQPEEIPDNLTAKQVRFFTPDFVKNLGSLDTKIALEGFK